MADFRIETFIAWDVIGWSLPRNNLFKMWLVDYRRAKAQPPRRCEAYFITPSSLKLNHISSGPGNRVSVVNVTEDKQGENRAFRFQLMQNGSVEIVCYSAELVFLP